MNLLKTLLLPAALCIGFPTMSYGTSLQLTQDGWAFGGPLTLSFTGQDSDLDGWIEQSELNTFQAVYGLPGGSSTEWHLHDLEPDGFFFSDPGNFLIFARNPEYSLVDIGFEGEVLASIFDQFLFPFDETQTAPVPTPEPNGMVFVGLTAMSGLVLRKRRKQSVNRSIDRQRRLHGICYECY